MRRNSVRWVGVPGTVRGEYRRLAFRAGESLTKIIVCAMAVLKENEFNSCETELLLILQLLNSFPGLMSRGREVKCIHGCSTGGTAAHRRALQKPA
jgi:hypothetical protein